MQNPLSQVFHVWESIYAEDISHLCTMYLQDVCRSTVCHRRPEIIPKCHSVGNQLDKFGSIHIMKFYAAIKKRENIHTVEYYQQFKKKQTAATTHERSQIQRNAY